MERINLDTAPRSVRTFMQGLNVSNGGIELAVAGRVLCKLVPATQLSESERRSVLARGRALIRRAQERNTGVPAAVLTREIRQAVNEVRGRRR